MRVLLAEDDALLGDGIRAGLKLADYAVDWVRDGEMAHLALQDNVYDACVLDLGLPRRDGLSVSKALRERGNALPVLILTARDASTDKIAGLDSGADDYLTKPFDLAELQARLRALTGSLHQLLLCLCHPGGCLTGSLGVGCLLAGLRCPFSCLLQRGLCVLGVSRLQCLRSLAQRL